MDGTLTPHRSIWQHLHESLGLWVGLAEDHWRRYRASEIDYDEFCALDAAHWEGLPLDRAREIIDAVPYNRGVAEGLRRLRRGGLAVALLSTGLTLLTERIEREFDLQWSLANHLTSVDGRLTGRAEVRVRDGDKAWGLRALSADLGVPPERMIGVGDGSNDRQVAERVGWFVAHRCHDERLARLADHVCETDDFNVVVDRIGSWCGWEGDEPRRRG